MFDWIGDLFTKIWKAVKKVLPYILIACAIWLTMGFAIPLFAGLVIEGTVMNALLFLGASFLLAPGETATALQPAVEAIGDVAQNAAKEVGGVVGSLLGSLSDSLGVPSLLLIAGIGIGAYFLLKSNKSTEADVNDGKKSESAHVSKASTAVEPGNWASASGSIGLLNDSVGGVNA